MAGVNWNDLSIVIFDELGHVASIQKSILRGSGARKVAVAENIDSLRKELIFGRDIVLINWTAPTDDFAPLIAGLRHPGASPDPYVGIILVAPVTNRQRIELALRSGAHSLLGFPFRPVDFSQQIARLALNPGVFIESETYCGPDRRRKSIPHGEAERRVSTHRTFSGADLVDERRRLRHARIAALEVAPL